MTLVEARSFLGWNQSKLAREAGISISSLNDLEHGRNTNPGYAQVMKIITALRSGGLRTLSPDDVFPVPATVEKAS